MAPCRPWNSNSEMCTKKFLRWPFSSNSISPEINVQKIRIHILGESNTKYLSNHVYEHDANDEQLFFLVQTGQKVDPDASCRPMVYNRCLHILRWTVVPDETSFRRCRHLIMKKIALLRHQKSVNDWSSPSVGVGFGGQLSASVSTTKLS